VIELDREEVKARVREILERHEGPGDCITMTALHSQATGQVIIPWRRYDQSRLVRSLVAELRREGCPIGDRGGREGGYFWAADRQQLEPTIAKLHARALSSLRQEAVLKRVRAEELLQQYEIELSTEEEPQ
jgi:hypothetical protein